jgi:hypothetical protein
LSIRPSGPPDDVSALPDQTSALPDRTGGLPNHTSALPDLTTGLHVFARLVLRKRFLVPPRRHRQSDVNEPSVRVVEQVRGPTSFMPDDSSKCRAVTIDEVLASHDAYRPGSVTPIPRGRPHRVRHRPTSFTDLGTRSR